MIAPIVIPKQPISERPIVAPLFTAIEVLEEPKAAIVLPVVDDARPTVVQPQCGATGLFAGWGPRLR